MSTRKELDQLYSNVRSAVAERGWVPIEVRDPKNGANNFIYTVGLTTLKLPEVVLTGASALSQSSRYLKDFIDALVNGAPFELDVPFTFKVVDSRSDNHNRSSLRRCMLRTLTPESIKEKAYFAVNQKVCLPTHGLVQLILADDQNRLPTEKGYNSSLVQPLI
ncbi:hypothetical protein [Erwinia phage vB_Ea277G]|nr:hypothetical protein [Erwinia phage vB_Ea277G]